MALANNGLDAYGLDDVCWKMKTEHEIQEKLEELRKIRFEHGKDCQIPLDKCDVAKEYDLLIDVLEWVLKS